MKALRPLVMLLAFIPSAVFADVEVLGLFQGAALIKVDGRQKLVKAGHTFAGVTIISSDSKQAIAEIDGEQQILTLSTHITTRYKEIEKPRVLIRRNELSQYLTSAEINGRTVQVLVDTGANIMALNSATANSLGIDYQSGQRSTVNTASGTVPGYRVTLDSVVVGDIRVNHVSATVLEGTHPQQVLLGVSFLQHVEMQERDGILMLLGKF